MPGSGQRFATPAIIMAGSGLRVAGSGSRLATPAIIAGSGSRLATPAIIECRAPAGRVAVRCVLRPRPGISCCEHLATLCARLTSRALARGRAAPRTGELVHLKRQATSVDDVVANITYYHSQRWWLQSHWIAFVQPLPCRHVIHGRHAAACCSSLVGCVRVTVRRRAIIHCSCHGRRWGEGVCRSSWGITPGNIQVRCFKLRCCSLGCATIIMSFFGVFVCARWLPTGVFAAFPSLFHGFFAFASATFGRR